MVEGRWRREAGAALLEGGGGKRHRRRGWRVAAMGGRGNGGWHARLQGGTAEGRRQHMNKRLEDDVGRR